MGADVNDDDDDGTTVQTEYDWTTMEPSTAIVETIATLTERDPTDISPLFGIADPDAIDSLLLSGEAPRTGDISVSLQLDDHEVTVTRDGVVTVSSIPSESPE